MKQAKKSPYNLWQNSAFMVQAAWGRCKSVVPMCIALAVARAGQTVAELLIAPGILRTVETAAPLSEVFGAIGIFTLALLIFSALARYLDEITPFGRIDVRMSLIDRLNRKMARTAYPNLLDTRFLQMWEKSWSSTITNRAPIEHIWTTWTDLLTNVLGFLVYLVLLSGLHPLLLAVVIATTAVGYAVTHRINQWGYLHREVEAEYLKPMEYLEETITGRTHAKDIRIFGLRPWLDQVWNDAFRLYQGFLARRERAYLWATAADLVLALLRNGVAYGYLIALTLRQGLSASQFLLYFTAVSGFTQWITGILQQVSTLQKESLELSTLRELLQWPEPFRFEDGQPLPRPQGPCELKLENVSYRYPGADRDTISHMNLTIHPGEKLAIVGLNGAGKTTLVKLLCGFLDPTEGRVLLNGTDIRIYDRRAYYDLFSAVFQDFSVLEATVAENVAQRVDGIDTEKVWRCLDQAGLTEKVRSLPQGLDTHIGRQVFEDGVELSGGQTQRLMLARALYKDGPILALDEPTAALDPLAENDIYLKYNEMTRGRTSVFISHRLASTRFCDRILFLEHGVIAEEGTHEALLARGGGYAHLFEVQSQYYQEGGSEDGREI